MVRKEVIRMIQKVIASHQNWIDIRIIVGLHEITY